METAEVDSFRTVMAQEGSRILTARHSCHGLNYYMLEPYNDALSALPNYPLTSTDCAVALSLS